MTRKLFDNIHNNELTPLQKRVINYFLKEGLSDEEMLARLAEGKKDRPKDDEGKDRPLDRTVCIQHIRKINDVFKKKLEMQDSDLGQREFLVNLFVKYRPQLVCQRVREQYNLPFELSFPEGSERLDSMFYIELNELENDCYNHLVKPGALARIRAPKQMGKTSFMRRIKDKAQNDGTRCVEVDFSQFEFDEAQPADLVLSTFLRRLKEHIILELPDVKPNTKRNNDISDVLGFTHMFQSILKEMNCDLILFFDEVDYLFNYSKVYHRFFSMIRNWHNDRASDSEQSEYWGKVKLVLAYSTEDYGKLSINQSPFNVGRVFQLEDLTPTQINYLYIKHGIEGNLKDAANKLRELVGGHPYLLRLGLYHLMEPKKTIQEILIESTTDGGIYKSHLEMLLENLKNNSEICSLYKRILSGDITYLRSETFEYKRLEHMGLIRRDNEKVLPRRDLYYRYFQNRL
jgi:hypothetical protein